MKSDQNKLENNLIVIRNTCCTCGNDNWHYFVIIKCRNCKLWFIKFVPLNIFCMSSSKLTKSSFPLKRDSQILVNTFCLQKKKFFSLQKCIFSIRYEKAICSNIESSNIFGLKQHNMFEPIFHNFLILEHTPGITSTR